MGSTGRLAEGELDAHAIAVTYGYSRDHREDLKQWMLALITSDEGVPHFLKPLDGNASDKASLPQVVRELTRHLRESGETAGVYVADSGLYSEANLRALNAAERRLGESGARRRRQMAQAVVREEPVQPGSRATTGSSRGGVGPMTCPRDGSAG